jgi:hypothetical protein
LFVNDVPRATLQVPPSCPAPIVRWAESLIEEDIAHEAPAPVPPKMTVLEIANALELTPAEAIDRGVKARLYENPTRDYRSVMLELLADEPALAPAYHRGG